MFCQILRVEGNYDSTAEHTHPEQKRQRDEQFHEQFVAGEVVCRKVVELVAGLSLAMGLLTGATCSPRT